MKYKHSLVTQRRESSLSNSCTWLISLSFIIYHLSFSVACSDFLYDDSDQVAYADKNLLTDDADTLWAVAGIMNKMQVIADRTILLGEVRGDLVTLTNDASADLRAIANFETTSNLNPQLSTLNSQFQ